MTSPTDLAHFGVPQRDPGWIYAARSVDLVKIGKTTDPKRRLLREAKTWCPNGLDETIVRPFWNIGRIEYSLHSALAEHWHRGEWHKFTSDYWMTFFLDAFRQFGESESARDKNSIDFAYWMNGTNYSEQIEAQCERGMTLKQWQQCHGDPWLHTRESMRAEQRHRAGTSASLGIEDTYEQRSI